MVKAGVFCKIKKAKSYTISELANLTKKSEATVRKWTKDGMPILKDCKPHLIIGVDARVFLKKRYHATKRKLKIGEIRCFTCQDRKMLAFGMAEIVTREPSGWQLRGVCECCGSLGSRWIAERDIPLHAKKLGIENTAGIQAYSGPPFSIQTSISEGQDTHA